MTESKFPDPSLVLWRENVYKRVGLDKLRGKNVLDVGCGEGVVSRHLSKLATKVTGFDIESFEGWKKKIPKNLSFLVADAHHMPFKARSFDGIFLQDVLHHVQDPEKVLQEIDRVTKKGATIILVEGNRYNPIFYVHMTKLRGHEHFSFTRFKNMVIKRFPSATFTQFESHYIPGLSLRSYMFVEHIIEKIFDTTPLLNRFKSYNAAFIEKQ